MTKKIDEVTRWLDEGINLKTREIDLSEDVDSDSIATVWRAVKQMVAMSNDPITLYISTYGGDIYHAFKLYDLLRSLPCLIITKGSGPIMSAGLLLLVAGDVRDITPNSRIMGHEVSEHIWDSRKTSEMENDLEAQKDIEGAMLKELSDRTLRSKEWWKKTIKHRDVYINREKALKLGIITGGVDEEE